ncbi:hypothetical protein D6C98_08239 [Aureobasidium pullulans]|nr:hypothetical protein D6C98_08239 [Aureobasidium pullulans]
MKGVARFCDNSKDSTAVVDIEVPILTIWIRQAGDLIWQMARDVFIHFRAKNSMNKVGIRVREIYGKEREERVYSGGSFGKRGWKRWQKMRELEKRLGRLRGRRWRR